MLRTNSGLTNGSPSARFALRFEEPDSCVPPSDVGSSKDLSGTLNGPFKDAMNSKLAMGSLAAARRPNSISRWLASSSNSLRSFAVSRAKPIASPLGQAGHRLSRNARSPEFYGIMPCAGNWS